ncbi:MAG: cupredoxin domain-containing protein [Alphaproteobacteria bacterium]|nr:cupredoxin domain-containing protein [Alphaproteobacteria bacterium]
MRFGRFVRTAFAAAALAAAVAPSHAADDLTIIQNHRSFQPSEITIQQGQTLHFENDDEFIHQIYVDSDQMSFDSAEQPPGETITITFPKAGTFNVRCHIHPKMLLVVHVK